MQAQLSPDHTLLTCIRRNQEQALFDVTVTGLAPLLHTQCSLASLNASPEVPRAVPCRLILTGALSSSYRLLIIKSRPSRHNNNNNITISSRFLDTDTVSHLVYTHFGENGRSNRRHQKRRASTHAGLTKAAKGRH